MITEQGLTAKPKDYFYMSNGQIIKSLRELPDLLEKIDNRTFFAHVTPYRNDFAKWAYEVFNAEDLSERIGSVKSKEEIIRILKAYVRGYNPKKNAEFAASNQAVPARAVLQPSQVMRTMAVSPKADTNSIPSTIPKAGSSSGNIFIPGQVPDKGTGQTATPGKNLKENSPAVQESSNPLNKAVQQASSSNQAGHQFSQKEDTPVIPPVQSIAQKRRVYVWKTSETSEYVLKPKMQPAKKDQAAGKKEEKREEKTEEKKEEKIESIKRDAPQRDETKEQAQRAQKHIEDAKITDADSYFLKNPVLISQKIEAKKATLEIEPLDLVSFGEDEPPAKLAEIFKDNYSKAYQRLSFLRKNGFDTSIAEIMLFRIPPKIKLYEASRESKDAVQARRYLNEIIEELNNMKH